MYYLTMICLNFALLFGCYPKAKQSYDSISGFDISSDNKYVYYSLSSSQNTLRRLDIIEGNDSLVLTSPIDKRYWCPSISRDESKLVFIESSLINRTENKIVFLDLSNSIIKSVNIPSGIISSLVYSHFKEEIYFTLAEEYGHYSPIGIDAPHKYDIYLLEINTGTIVKMTDKRAYGIYNIIEIDSLSIAFFLQGDDKWGIYSMNKATRTIKSIAPINDARTNFYVYGKDDDPVYSMPAFDRFNNVFAFVCAYEIFVIDKTSLRAKSILVSERHLSDMKFLNNGSGDLLITKNKEPYFYLLKKNTSEIKKIKPLND